MGWLSHLIHIPAVAALGQECHHRPMAEHFMTGSTLAEVRGLLDQNHYLGGGVRTPYTSSRCARKEACSGTMETQWRRSCLAAQSIGTLVQDRWKYHAWSGSQQWRPHSVPSSPGQPAG